MCPTQIKAAGVPLVPMPNVVTTGTVAFVSVSTAAALADIATSFALYAAASLAFVPALKTEANVMSAWKTPDVAIYNLAFAEFDCLYNSKVFDGELSETAAMILSVDVSRANAEPSATSVPSLALNQGLSVLTLAVSTDRVVCADVEVSAARVTEAVVVGM